MPQGSFTVSNTTRRFLLCISCICFITIYNRAQTTNEADSLRTLITHMKNDSQKVNIYYQLNLLLLRQFELDQLDETLSEIKVLCDKLGDESCTAHYYNHKGLISIYRGQFPEALTYFNQALHLREKANDRKGMADNLSNIGMIYDQQGDYRKAIEFFQKALSLRSESDLRGKSAAYTNLGLVYYKLGDYAAALPNYLESLRLDELTGNKQDIAYSNNNLGLFYAYQNNIPQALHYYKKANEMCKEIGDRECIAGTNRNIGSLHSSSGDFMEALDFYLESLKIFEDVGSAPDIQTTQGAIGNLYRDLKDYDSALKYLKSSLATAEEMNLLPGIATTSCNLGVLYRDLGQYEEAKKMFNRGLVIYQESGELEHLSNIYKNLSHLDSVMGNFPSALVHYKKYIFYKDSLNNEASLKFIAEIQTKFETDKKDKEILILEGEKENQQLQLSLQDKTLRQRQAEENRLRVENLMHLQHAELMNKERQVHLLEIENSKTRELVQHADLASKENELTLMNNIALLHQGEVRKQRITKNLIIGGFILSALLTLFGYHYYVTRQKLKLQTLRNKIASDLHDDVGSTLSSISIFSEIAQQQSREFIPMLDTIRESSHKMLDAMGDIVWTINPENDHFEKILTRMRNFAFALLGAKKIDFEFIADEEVNRIELPMEARKNLYLIFKEAANNLVKYSNADKAHFSIKKEMGFLTLLIRDNGKGFDPNSEELGNGIKSMKKRAEEIGARLHIDTAPGKGTAIELKLAV